jgi:hypothetical protein
MIQRCCDFLKFLRVMSYVCVCVFITAEPIINLFAGGGVSVCVYYCSTYYQVGPVRNQVLLHRVGPCFPWYFSFGKSVCVCVCVYYCSTYYKAVRVGKGG